MKRIKVDLPMRTEKRYILPNSKEFLDKIISFTEELNFSDNKYVQTIYFNNDEHILPFGLSIKARRYLPESLDFPVSENDIFFLDLKITKKGNKQKIRLETTLKEAVEIINKENSFLEIPLQPYISVQYFRQHYIPKNLEGIRITLDSDMKYFFFFSKKDVVEIGKEDSYTRIEIKKKKGQNEDFEILINKILNELEAFPVISKKYTSYNFLKKYRLRKYAKPLYKELKELEIESKLEVELETKSNIFYKIKQFFRENNSKFVLPSHYPYVHESASINRYYKNDTGLFKALIKGDKARIITKSDEEIIKDQYNLDCILKRKEIKGERIPVWSTFIQSAELLGELSRKRKAFWVENPQNKRIYHISLDHCRNFDKYLHQIEVEYTGRYIEEDTKEDEIIKDIADITNILIKNFPELKPSQLTKQDWLGI